MKYEIQKNGPICDTNCTCAKSKFWMKKSPLNALHMTKIVQGIQIWSLNWHKVTYNGLQFIDLLKNQHFFDKMQLWLIFSTWCYGLLRNCKWHEIVPKLWAFRWGMSQYCAGVCRLVLRSNVQEFIKNCHNCLKLYEELSDSLQYFFFVVFFTMQIWLIFSTFVSMSRLLKMTDISNADLFLAGSYLVVIATGVFCMIMQTEVIDQAFQDLQYLRRQAQEKLLYSSEKSERNQLKFLLRRLEMMEPMNGCGYFGIDKTTLTSMLSVR